MKFLCNVRVNANTLSVKARRFENLNPYSIVKPQDETWRNGVELNVNQSRQVAVIAERSITIDASEYILNSSAVIGQNQGGDFVINTPKLMNQRYRITADIATFSRITQSSSDSVRSQTSQHMTGAGVETYLTEYSPPGVIYSFGRLLFSDGVEGNAEGQFINQFSFLEILKDAHLHETKLHSIGLAMAGRPLSSTSYIRCATYGCSSSTYTSYIEYETLTSFAGDVYGVNNELKVQTVNQLDDASKQAILDVFIKNFEEEYGREETILNPSNIDASAVHYHNYITSWGVYPSSRDEVLRIAMNYCIRFDWRRRPNTSTNNLNNTCHSREFEYTVASILNTVADDKVADCLGYSNNELNEKAAEYLSGFDYPGSFKLLSSTSFRTSLVGNYYHKLVSWASHDDCQTLTLNYIKKFRPTETGLSESEARQAGYFQEGSSLDVDLDELMGTVIPSVPGNMRYSNKIESTGKASLTLHWDAVPGNNIRYELSTGENLGTKLSHSLSITGQGSFTRGFRVRACNTAHCSDWAVVSVNFVLPLPRETIQNCLSPFYTPFMNDYKGNAGADSGYYCGVKTYEGIEYYMLTYKRFYIRWPGDSGTYYCEQRQLYKLDTLVDALTKKATLPSAPTKSLSDISGYADSGEACGVWLQGFSRLTK